MGPVHGVAALLDPIAAPASVSSVESPSTAEESRIRPADRSDLERLRDIERAAGRAFTSIGMEVVAAHEPPSIGELAVYQQSGRSWVSVDDGGKAVAYILVDRVDGCGHVEQVSVHPDYAGHGLGRRLLDTAQQWAAEHGLDALTLTTFVEVAWNGPYYRRCGFRFLDRSEETAGLRAIRAHEAELGLDSWARACMRREFEEERHRPPRLTGPSS